MIEEYEACSPELIKSAFEKFQRLNLMKMTPWGNKKEVMVEVLVGLEQVEALES